ncbi:SDR family oxidoreductase [Zhengella mangrovi]|uniref:SDR family oxidoreductase n=1 Tax=Zhengella mangrovi TaxID=1982044 RepID=UPI001FDF9918|nr:SDR family oxidoreductase [Zhengella mangrovi]
MPNRLFDLSGQTALVTGGSRGLGLQIAEGIVEAGGRVVLTARKQGELDTAARHLEALGGQVATIACDLQKLEGIEAVVDRALAAFGAIDMLVNNAGASWGAPMVDYPLEGWMKVMTLNVTAPFMLTQAVGRKAMIPAGRGRILNIASIGGLRGNRPDMEMHTIAYNTSKAAIINFTRALASEWGRHDINVNALCPGFFPSKMSAGLLSDIEERLLPAVPLGRLGGEADLKGPAVFLLSGAARHVTGQALAVDGGASAV